MEISTLFLGTIAVATLVMAVVQVGIIVYGARLARSVQRLVDQMETEIKPALTHVNAMSDDINRVTALAVAQLERVDQLFGQFTERSDQLMTVAQEALIGPVRQGAALLQGMRAALAALRRSAGGTQPDSGEPVGDDEEALFIG